MLLYCAHVLLVLTTVWSETTVYSTVVISSSSDEYSHVFHTVLYCTVLYCTVYLEAWRLGVDRSPGHQFLHHSSVAQHER